MDFSTWLPLQALGTLLIVVGFAYWSWKRTRRAKAEQGHRPASPLARTSPDPKFQPDAEVTDPFHVAPGHGDAPGAAQARAGMRPDADVTDPFHVSHGTPDPTRHAPATAAATTGGPAAGAAHAFGAQPVPGARPTEERMPGEPAQGLAQTTITDAPEPPRGPDTAERSDPSAAAHAAAVSKIV